MAHNGGRGAIQQSKLSWKVALAAIAGAMVIATLVVVMVNRSGSGHLDEVRQPPLAEGQEELDLQQAADPARPLTAENLRWQTLTGADLPVGSGGPESIDGGRGTGFARNPQGAVLAAMYISNSVRAYGGPNVFQPAIAEQVVGADKNTFLSTVRREYEVAKNYYGADADGGLSKAREDNRAKNGGKGIWAYRLDVYSRDAATVNVLGLAVPPGTNPIYINFTYTVRWVQGDWRLVAPVNGVWSSYARNFDQVPPQYVVIGRG